MSRLLILALLGILAARTISAEDQKPGAQPQATNAAEEKTEPPPTTLEEAHLQLEQLLPQEELEKIDKMASEKDMIEYHFGLGMSMRNAWGLWGGGPLAEELIKLGAHHPDNMSGLILETFWCRRHHKDLRLKERADRSEAWRKAIARPPATAKDPQDGAAVDWGVFLNVGNDQKPRRIHAGRSFKTKRWLAYEHDKGVYEPDAALLQSIIDTDQFESAYRKAAAAPPATAKDPKDGSAVDWETFLDVGDDKIPRLIHSGRSLKTGRRLAYEHEKGVYEPDAAVLRKMDERALPLLVPQLVPPGAPAKD